MSLRIKSSANRITASTEIINRSVAKQAIFASLSKPALKKITSHQKVTWKQFCKMFSKHFKEVQDASHIKTGPNMTVKESLAVVRAYTTVCSTLLHSDYGLRSEDYYRQFNFMTAKDKLVQVDDVKIEAGLKNNSL